MQTIQQYSNILVVGLGITGLSVVHYLTRLGLQFRVVDSRSTPPGMDELRALNATIPTQFGEFQPAWFVEADCLVVSPGIAVSEPLIHAATLRGAAVVGDIELFVQVAPAPIIAITGANGKSTVTTLVGLMAEQAGLKAYAGGNLGTAALDLLNEPIPDGYVMELSSFQLETTHSLQAQAAVVLNISEDHMDRYPDLATYAATKAKIYRQAQYALLNRDDPMVMAMPTSAAKRLSFGWGEPQDESEYGLRDVGGVLYLAQGKHNFLPVTALKIPGLHNAANALAALALGHAFGLATEPMLVALQQFTGLAHRTCWVRERRGVQWYNDSKGTNVGATLAALSGMPNKTVLIAGGLGKGADFSPLAPALAEKARALVLIGEDRFKIAAIAEGHAPYVFADSMQDAIEKAAQLACEGDNVLLSPACASFDMFKNYVHRGEVFSALVQELPA